MIKQFIQGNPQTESELFSSLGSMVLAKEVHDKLGSSVNSRVGDIWWISYDRQGARMGFAQARIKNSELNVRYLYAIGLEAHSELITAIINYSKEAAHTRVFLHGNAGATMWEKAGFQFIPNVSGGLGIWEII